MVLENSVYFTYIKKSDFSPQVNNMYKIEMQKLLQFVKAPVGTHCSCNATLNILALTFQWAWSKETPEGLSHSYSPWQYQTQSGRSCTSWGLKLVHFYFVNTVLNVAAFYKSYSFISVILQRPIPPPSTLEGKSDLLVNKVINFK